MEVGVRWEHWGPDWEAGPLPTAASHPPWAHTALCPAVAQSSALAGLCCL